MRLFGPFAALLLMGIGASASGQTFGPPIQGLCLLSRTGAISASRAGQALQSQLKQMQASLSGELAQRRGGIDQQRRQLEARQNATAPIEYQRQLGALDQQARELEQQQNGRFIAAQERGQQQIDRALNEALGRVVTRNVCSLVVERNNTYGWNNAMDITAAVTREMDTLVQTVTIQ